LGISFAIATSPTTYPTLRYTLFERYVSHAVCHATRHTQRAPRTLYVTLVAHASRHSAHSVDTIAALHACIATCHVASHRPPCGAEVKAAGTPKDTTVLRAGRPRARERRCHAPFLSARHVQGAFPPIRLFGVVRVGSARVVQICQCQRDTCRVRGLRFCGSVDLFGSNVVELWLLRLRFHGYGLHVHGVLGCCVKGHRFLASADFFFGFFVLSRKQLHDHWRGPFHHISLPNSRRYRCALLRCGATLKRSRRHWFVC
jgi:hypothetical protein